MTTEEIENAAAAGPTVSERSHESAPSSASERPLVTFAVFAYNQEKYIREAIEGAFAQTYEPLEIILSDDCSTDRTFEIMQEMASKYAGPHEIILRRNDENLGVGAHINAAAKCVSSRMMILAAGDDISMPQRAERIVELWRRSGLGTIVVHSNVLPIEKDGRSYPDYDPSDAFDDSRYHDIFSLCRNNTSIMGASSAFTTNLLLDFPELLPELVHEDRCMPFRARLVDAPVVFISEQLVKYRINVGGLSEGYGKVTTYKMAEKIYRRFYVDYLQKKIDCQSLGRTDLLPAINNQLADYKFAVAACDRSVDDITLLREWFRLRSGARSLARIAKFRIWWRILQRSESSAS